MSPKQKRNARQQHRSKSLAAPTAGRGKSVPWRGEARRVLRLELLETRRLLDAGPVFINEFMAKNTKTYENNAGNYTDWLELYNPTSTAVTLGSGASETITGITYGTPDNLTATVTTAAADGYSTGESVIIAGATPTQYDGNFQITVTGSNTFTYTMASRRPSQRHGQHEPPPPASYYLTNDATNLSMWAFPTGVSIAGRRLHDDQLRHDALGRDGRVYEHRRSGSASNGRRERRSTTPASTCLNRADTWPWCSPTGRPSLRSTIIPSSLPTSPTASRRPRPPRSWQRGHRQRTSCPRFNLFPHRLDERRFQRFVVDARADGPGVRTGDVNAAHDRVVNSQWRLLRAHRVLCTLRPERYLELL